MSIHPMTKVTNVLDITNKYYAAPKAIQLYVVLLDKPLVPLVPKVNVPPLTELAVDVPTEQVRTYVP